MQSSSLGVLQKVTEVVAVHTLQLNNKDSGNSILNIDLSDIVNGFSSFLVHVVGQLPSPHREITSTQSFQNSNNNNNVYTAYLIVQSIQLMCQGQIVVLRGQICHYETAGVSRARRSRSIAAVVTVSGGNVRMRAEVVDAARDGEAVAFGTMAQLHRLEALLCSAHVKHRSVEG